MIEKLNLHYSFTNPASIHDEEALTALELAGRQGAKINEVVDAQNNLSANVDKRLNAQDADIANQKNNVIPASIEKSVQNHINKGAFDTQINNYVGDLAARVNSIIANPETGSTAQEVIDIRTDHTAHTHASAGDAVRFVGETMERQVEGFEHGNYVYPFHWESGTIDVNTGAEIASLVRLRSNYMTIDSGYINLKLGENIKVLIMEYTHSANGYAVNKSLWVSKSVTVNFEPGSTHFRVVIGYQDDAEVPSNIYHMVEVSRPIAYFNEVNNLMYAWEGFAAKTVNHQYLIKNVHNIGDGSCANTRRWFVDGVIPSGAFIRDISLRFVATHPASIELWSVTGNTLTLLDSLPVNGLAGSVVRVPVKRYALTPVMISVKSDEICIRISTGNNGHQTLVTSELEPTTLNKSTFSTFDGYLLCADVDFDYYIFDNAPPNVLSVGPGQAFNEIQEAIDTITDTEESYIINVYPRKEPYNRFSLTRKLTEGYSTIDRIVRNISIIGMDKTKCIVRDDSGEYLTPPCEALTNGVIKNMQFIATHEKQVANGTRGSYAVHIDAATLNNVGYDMAFEDCIFKSYQAPAVGVGLQWNSHLKFKNCEFFSDVDLAYQPDENYRNLGNYGAFFCHANSADGVKGQYLTLDSCRFTHTTGDRVVWIEKAGGYTPENSEMMVTAYNNICYGGAEGAKRAIRPDIIPLHPSSFGNNALALNATDITE